MKKGIWSLGVVVLAGLMFLGVGVLKSAEKQAPPEEVTISNEGYKTDKKGPVKLNHKEHFETLKIVCTECHHKYENGKNVLKKGDHIQKCAECHSPLKKEGKVLKLNLAYHKNCKTCHKAINNKDPSKKPPFKKCTGCHQKK